MNWRKVLDVLRVPSKPNFLIVGTTKGGTTAIFNYLRNHPGIVSSWQKELNFFSRDANYNRGSQYYHSLFHPDFFWRNKACFEASPQYMFLPWSAKRIYEYNPALKLLVFLRNPIDRAYSQWNMHMQIKAHTLESDLKNASTNNPEIFAAFKAMYAMPNFENFDALVRELAGMHQQKPDLLEPSILSRGLYATQLKNLLQYFPASQMLILESSYCKSNTFEALDRICDFVGAGKMDWGRIQFSSRKSHERSYTEAMRPETRAFLADFYKKPNEELFQLLNEKYDWQ